MANQKAILTKYIRTEQGWRYARVILHKNGTVKGVMVGGQEGPIAKYSEGQYQVKTYAGSNPVYRSVGNDPVDAVRDWRMTQLAMSNPDLEMIQQGPRPVLKAPSGCPILWVSARLISIRTLVRRW
jgi:hypothetical protein